MNNYTTVEADPRGAASFLRAWKARQQEERQKEEQRESRQYRPDRYEQDWFGRGTEEVQERLGRPSLWTNPSIVGKGWDYELLVGVNIGGNHSVIDDVHAYEGIVTSMKTMDTQAPIYQYPNMVFDKGKEYVDAYDRFRGVDTVDGFRLPFDQIRGFYLEIGVRDNLLPGQREELEKVQAYGEEKGVRVIIAEVA